MTQNEFMFLKCRISMVFLLLFIYIFLPLRYKKSTTVIILILSFIISGLVEYFQFIILIKNKYSLIATILSIINNAPKNVEKYIISSNNDYEVLRKEMLKKCFYIQKEIVIKDKDKYYPIIIFTKEFQKENKLSLKYGKSNNKEYYKYLEEKEKSILKSIPKKHIITRLSHKIRIKELKKLQN